MSVPITSFDGSESSISSASLNKVTDSIGDENKQGIDLHIMTIRIIAKIHGVVIVDFVFHDLTDGLSLSVVD